MLKKLLTLGIVLAMLFSAFALTGCEKEDEEMKEILKQFDLTDPKETWDGNINDPDIYHPNVIFVVFKKTKQNAYPELELKHFNFSSAMKVERLEYMNLQKPSTWAESEVFRQSAFIHLSESTAETLLSVIRHLESLVFIQQVEPGIMLYPLIDY